MDATGKVVATNTVYPARAAQGFGTARCTIAQAVRDTWRAADCDGNGTASRETDQLAADLIKQLGAGVTKVVVSEAGASVYSASEYASGELPDLDVSLRGAVSIARRLQGPGWPSW